MKVADILAFLHTIAPVSMKMDWDNVGLLCGSSTAEVTKILVALDPFESACQEAVDIGAELLVTHHPLIFSPVKSVTDETGTGRSILLLARNGISAINAHTNLDCAPGGVNDCLAEAIGLQNVEVINPAGVDEAGHPWGLLRMGQIAPMALVDFLDHVKGALHCPGVRYVSGSRPVHRIAVGGGACADGIMDAFCAGCDTFVTADVKYNQFWTAKDLGMNLVDAGHFWTENPVCFFLARQLQTHFPEIQVTVSQNHTDCVKFW